MKRLIKALILLALISSLSCGILFGGLNIEVTHNSEPVGDISKGRITFKENQKVIDHVFQVEITKDANNPKIELVRLVDNNEVRTIYKDGTNVDLSNIIDLVRKSDKWIIADNPVNPFVARRGFSHKIHGTRRSVIWYEDAGYPELFRGEVHETISFNYPKVTLDGDEWIGIDNPQKPYPLGKVNQNIIKDFISLFVKRNWKLHDIDGSLNKELVAPTKRKLRS
jgi:hypothetical protein